MNAGLTKVEEARKHFKGYSLLDLQRAARLKGYQAAGFKLTVEQLTQLAAPVIVFVQPLGYKHFAVLRGVDRGRVFIAESRAWEPPYGHRTVLRRVGRHHLCRGQDRGGSPHHVSAGPASA